MFESFGEKKYGPFFIIESIDYCSKLRIIAKNEDYEMDVTIGSKIYPKTWAEFVGAIHMNKDCSFTWKYDNYDVIMSICGNIVHIVVIVDDVPQRAEMRIDAAHCLPEFEKMYRLIYI